MTRLLLNPSDPPNSPSRYRLPGSRPRRFEIIGEASAGKPCYTPVGEGQAVRIMTGAMLPPGADTVVKLEDAVEDGAYVICRKPPVQGRGIRFRGESLRKADRVLRAGG